MAFAMKILPLAIRHNWNDAALVLKKRSLLKCYLGQYGASTSRHCRAYLEETLIHARHEESAGGLPSPTRARNSRYVLPETIRRL
jgi:hypothetical protein